LKIKMSEKIKEDLMKTLAYYYEIKLNVKYLIYFNKQQQLTNVQTQSQAQTLSSVNDSTMMVITDGIDCWSLCISDDKFINNTIKLQLNEKISYIEFLNHLISCLNNEKFELNQILSNSNQKGHSEHSIDLIEFKFSINNNVNKSQNGLKCVLLLDPILSKLKANEIKNALFFVYQKFTKTDQELKKMRNNLNNGQNDTSNACLASNHGNYF